MQKKDNANKKKQNKTKYGSTLIEYYRQIECPVMLTQIFLMQVFGSHLIDSYQLSLMMITLNSIQSLHDLFALCESICGK